MQTPYFTTDTATLYHGDALAMLREMPDASVDAVITDPPYSSGGAFRGDRTGSGATKYLGDGRPVPLPEFEGDTRDQRSFGYWCALWMGEARRVTKPGGVIGVATDWRQLPSVTDAIQAGGWVWRGVLAWAKPDARPQLGRYRQACEFYVWGTNGPRPMEGPTLPGFWLERAPRNQERVHQTQKPMAMYRDLVKIAPPGGVVMDPFAGAATTGVAAVLEGRRFLGVELSKAYIAIAAERLAKTTLGGAATGLTLFDLEAS